MQKNNSFLLKIRNKNLRKLERALFTLFMGFVLMIVFICMPYFSTGSQSYENFHSYLLQTFFLHGDIVELLSNYWVLFLAVVFFFASSISSFYEYKKDSSKTYFVDKICFDDFFVTFLNKNQIYSRFSYDNISSLNLKIHTGVISHVRGEAIYDLISMNLQFVCKNGNLEEIEHYCKMTDIYNLLDFRDKFNEFSYNIIGPDCGVDEKVRAYELNRKKLTFSSPDKRGLFVVLLILGFGFFGHSLLCSIFITEIKFVLGAIFWFLVMMFSLISYFKTKD